MKKIITALLAMFALSASAGETVTIVYSWTAGDQAANYYRTMAEAANQAQTRYTFVVDYKPGAGGAVAAGYVGKTPNTILATSSAFFIRPLLYSSGYTTDTYQELFPVCFAPFAISSTRYRTWAEVPRDRHLTIGISGLGSTTHLTALQIQRRYPQMDIIPFKSTSEATMATLSGQTDFAVNILGDVAQYQHETKLHSKMYVLGTGGSKSVDGYPLLIDQGFGPVMSRMGSPAQLIVSNAVSEDKVADWRRILSEASRTPDSKNAQRNDYCSPTAEMLTMHPEAYYTESRLFWRRQTAGVKVD